MGVSHANQDRTDLAVAAFTRALAARSVPNKAADIRCIHERAKALQIAGHLTEVCVWGGASAPRLGCVARPEACGAAGAA